MIKKPPVVVYKNRRKPKIDVVFIPDDDIEPVKCPTRYADGYNPGATARSKKKEK